MTLEDENKELKRLLRLAVNDIRWLAAHNTAEGECIVDKDIDCCCCPLSAFDINDYSVHCRWEHEEEALKLIKELRYV